MRASAAPAGEASNVTWRSGAAVLERRERRGGHHHVAELVEPHGEDAPRALPGVAARPSWSSRSFMTELITPTTTSVGSGAAVADEGAPPVACGCASTGAGSCACECTTISRAASNSVRARSVGRATRRIAPHRLVADVEQHRATAGDATCFDVVEDVADHPRAIERELEVGRGAQQQPGLGLAAAAARAGPVRAGVDACKLDAVLGELRAHVGVQRVERRVVEQAEADARLVGDDHERVAVGLQQHQAFDRVAREPQPLRVDVVGNVLDERAVAIDEDRRARGGTLGGDGRVHDTTSGSCSGCDCADCSKAYSCEVIDGVGTP